MAKFYFKMLDTSSNARILLFLSIFVRSIVEGYTPFILADCTTSSNRLVTIDGGLLDYPLTLPGDVRASGTVTIHDQVSAVPDGYRLDVSVQKYILFDYFMLPCISNVGSCSYDPCWLLSWFEDRGCPSPLRNSQVPCMCPFESGTYNLRPFPFTVPQIHPSWLWIAMGDFRVTGRLYNTTTGEELNCYMVEFTVQEQLSRDQWDFTWWPFVGLALIPFVSALNFVMKDCNNSPNKILHFEHAHLSADPVHIPGPETASIDVQVLQPISGNYTLQLKVQKHVLFGFVDVPCISDVGSCSYELCDILSGRNFNTSHHCPQEIELSTPDFPCTCPFQPGNYHLNPTTFMIPELSGVLKWLAQGDYKAHAVVIDSATSEEVACYDIQVTTESDCTGIACLFGKRSKFIE